MCPHHHYLQLGLNRYQDVQTEAIIPDTYQVNHRLGQDYLLGTGQSQLHVEFRSYSVGHTVTPAPDPRLIALHAACAGIANMSGAAGYLEERYRDTEDIAVMTQPGAAHELTRVLKTFQMVAPTP